VGQFGDKFRKAREKKGISLDDVSNVTKISSRMLQAIENERFDQLPGGVFNKGFIRAYARHVGLNDEEAVNEYLACLRQAQIDAQAVWEPNTGGGKRPQVAAHQIAANQVVASKVSHQTARSAVRQTEVAAQTEELPELHLPRLEHVRTSRREFGQKRGPLPWRPVVITLLLLIAVGVLWQRRMRHARAQEAAVPAPVAPQPSQTAPVPPPEPAASPSKPTSTPKAHAATANDKTAPENRTSAATTKPSSPTATVSDAEDDGTPPPDTASSVAVTKSPARFRLVIHADENSWISVTADGQPVSHETLIAPADAAIRANREVVARIGNAAGVSFVWNGQQFQPQGAEAEVKTFVFDENGMHEVPSAQTPTPSR
jgi:cytoskeletal protein RodZ